MTYRKPSTRITLLTLSIIVLLSVVSSAATGKINATDVKFRRQASTGSEIIDLLKKGTALIVVKKEADWYKVSVGNVNGYVYGQYITVQKEAPVVKKTEPKPAAPAPAVAKTVEPVAENEGTPAVTPVPAVTKTVESLVSNEVAPDTTTTNAAVAAATDTSGAAVTASGATAPAENKATVTANTLYIREGANADTKKLGEIVRNNTVVLLEKSGSWAKIKTEEGLTGYVLGQYILETDTQDSTVSSGNDSTVSTSDDSTVSRGDDSTIDSLITAALSMKGVKYVHGALSLKGTDCSGFVMMAYAKIGVATPRSAVSYGSAGVKVARKNLVPGDVVCFDTDGGKRVNISHVGIYLGNDQFIHASSTNRKVVIASFSGYQAKYLGAKRFIR